MAEKTEIDGKEIKLRLKQQNFCDHYIILKNGRQAAIKAGYSAKNAAHVASIMLQSEPIKAYIAKKYADAGLTAEETKKLITDRAKSNLADYMTPRKVPHTPMIEKKLTDVIKELEAEIEFEDEVFEMQKLTYGVLKHEIDGHHAAQTQRKKALIRYKVLKQKNPKGTVIVGGKTELIDQLELDIGKIVEDKEKGWIKSYKQTQHGVAVELCNSDGFLENVARMHGLFEKDNTQKTIPAVPITGMKVI